MEEGDCTSASAGDTQHTKEAADVSVASVLWRSQRHRYGSAVLGRSSFKHDTPPRAMLAIEPMKEFGLQVARCSILKIPLKRKYEKEIVRWFLSPQHVRVKWLSRSLGALLCGDGDWRK